MGWTWMHKPSEGAKAYLDKMLTWENEAGKRKVLDSALVNFTEYYAAVEHTHKDGKVEVWAAVAMVGYAPKAKDGYTFGYKEMDETMGPYMWSAPKRIMDLLTPTESANANEWRAKVNAKLAKPKPKKGQTVKFAVPLSFHNGLTKLDTFKYYKGSIFEAEGGLWRITNWKNREFTIGG